MGGIFINIQYELTREDFIKGKLENIYNIKEFKKTLFIKKYIISFIFFGGVTFLLKRNIYFFLFFSIVNLLFFSILYKKLLLKSIRKKAKYKTYNFSIDVDDNGIE